MHLSYHLSFEDLYTPRGLRKIHRLFLKTLQTENKALSAQYQRVSEGHSIGSALEESDFFIQVSLILEKFLNSLFSLEKETRAHQKKAAEAEIIFWARRHFVMRYALGLLGKKEVENLPPHQATNLLPQKLQGNFSQKKFAKAVKRWLKAPEKYKNALDQCALYTLWAIHTKQGQDQNKNSLLFKVPEPRDFANLIPWQKEAHHLSIKKEHLHPREGFSLTDKGPTLKAALIESQACIWCHEQGKDSCRKGLFDKEGQIKKNPLKNTLEGCPLDQKISEMHFLMAKGHFLAAAAVVMIDNPLFPLTGHRICNDCSAACIFQKQTPIDIPGAETRLLDTLLDLPYGFEIYSLLTKWNPLLYKEPLPLPQTKYHVLVAGGGPGGSAISHYLMRKGHQVTVIDGLKIEPLPSSLTGFRNKRPTFKPILKTKSLYADLDKRSIDGFGGVAEYGITSRWNKNYLKVIRLVLERNPLFALQGSVRLGSNITIDEAFDAGFDHVALCIGAGKPKILNIPGMFAKGVRQASDFLMALQLQGAARVSSTANMMIRLPIAVVGGGLTAIDAATEALAFYPLQLKKFKKHYDEACRHLGTHAVEALLQEEEKEIRDEFLSHEKELSLARSEKERQALLQKWGGARLFYRNIFTNAPSYRLNHHEVRNALKEGIEIEEEAQILSIERDSHGYAAGVSYESDQQKKVFHARTILVAIGTEPNTTIDADMPFLKKEGVFFELYENTSDNSLKKVAPSSPKAPTSFLTHMTPFKKGVSIFGDLHPSYYGSVVKALASVKNNYESLDLFLKNAPPAAKKIKDLFDARVEASSFLHKNLLELTIKAPFLTRKTAPGHLFRLHPLNKNTGHETEGIPLTYYAQNKKKGTLTFRIALIGASTTALTKLKKGMSVALMGPTGCAAFIPAKKNVLLLGKTCDTAFTPIKKAMQKKGCTIKTLSHQENLLENFLKLIQKGEAKRFDIIYVAATPSLMNGIQKTFYENKQYFSENCRAIALLNSPMQCMMKGVCAACLQKTNNKDSFIYGCLNQNQSLKDIDFQFLENRLNQNCLLEKIMNAAKKITYST